MQSAWIAVTISCVLLYSPLICAFADLENEEGDLSLHAQGSIRLTGAYLRYPDIPDLFPEPNTGMTATVLRLVLDGNLSNKVEYELNGWGEISGVPPVMGTQSLATTGSFDSPYRSPWLDSHFFDGSSATGVFGLDRANLSFDFEKLKVTVGRFPINYSVAGLFPVNDFFAPFSTTAINKIYKPGVDALQIGIPTGMMSNIEVTAVLGNDPNGFPAWGQSALLAHLRTVLFNYDFAILGGKLAERWIVGGSIQGELGRLGLKTEGHVGFPDDNGDGTLDRQQPYRDIYGRVSGGFDLLFDWQNAIFAMEYVYISNGALPDGYIERAAAFYPDDLLFLGKHYAGANAGAEIIPILRFDTMLLMNLLDGSGMASGFFSLSMGDEGDLLLGGFIPFGKRPVVDNNSISLESEYGIGAATIYMETRYYF